MKLGTKGQYAVMALVDLATNYPSLPVTLAEIAERQRLPLQYLEQLFVMLRRKGLVTSMRGQHGGYKLALDPSSVRISDIVLAVEEEVKTTRCAATSSKGCQGKNERCLTHDLWAGLEERIVEYLESISLADLCAKRVVPESKIQMACGG